MNDVWQALDNDRREVPEHIGRPWEVNSTCENRGDAPVITAGHVAAVRRLFEGARRSASNQQKSGVKATASLEGDANCNPEEICSIQDGCLEAVPRKQKEMRLDTDSEQRVVEGGGQWEEEEEPIEYLLLELIPHLPTGIAKDLLSALQQSEAEGQRTRKVIQELSKTSSITEEVCEEEVVTRCSSEKSHRPWVRFFAISSLFAALFFCLWAWWLYWFPNDHNPEMLCCNTTKRSDELSASNPEFAAVTVSPSKRRKLEQDIVAARAAHGTCQRKLQLEEEQLASRQKPAEKCVAPAKGASSVVGATHSTGRGDQALVLQDFVQEQRRQLANMSSEKERLQEEIAICTRCLAVHDMSGKC